MNLQDNMYMPPERLYPGIYKAEVLDLLDPLKLNRVRVRIWGVHVSEGLDDFLPWATYNDPMFGGVANNGSSFTPKIGATVHVMFIGGDMNQPVLMGGWLGQEKEMIRDVTEVTEAKRAYITTVKTASGNTITINDDPDNRYIKYYDASENYVNIEIPKDKAPIKVSVKLKGDVVMEVDGNITMSATKNISIHAGADIVLNSTGKSTIKSAKEMHVSSSKKMSIQADDDLRMTGSNNSSLDGGRIDIGSGRFSEVVAGNYKGTVNDPTMFVNKVYDKYTKNK